MLAMTSLFEYLYYESNLKDTTLASSAAVMFSKVQCSFTSPPFEIEVNHELGFVNPNRWGFQAITTPSTLSRIKEAGKWLNLKEKQEVVDTELC